MRQVSFTLLYKFGHYNGNSAQYERNRRFGSLVNVLVRKDSGTKLSAERLRLNASKSESRPDVMIFLCLPRNEATILSDVRIGCG